MAGQALSWKMEEKRILSDPQFTCLWEELRKGNEEKEDAMKGEKTFQCPWVPKSSFGKPL